MTLNKLFSPEEVDLLNVFDNFFTEKTGTSGLIPQARQGDDPEGGNAEKPHEPH